MLSPGKPCALLQKQVRNALASVQHRRNESASETRKASKRHDAGHRSDRVDEQSDWLTGVYPRTKRRHQPRGYRQYRHRTNSPSQPWIFQSLEEPNKDICLGLRQGCCASPWASCRSCLAKPQGSVADAGSMSCSCPTSFRKVPERQRLVCRLQSQIAIKKAVRGGVVRK